MAKTKTPCQCSSYAVQVVTDEGEQRQALDCDVETGGKFAPGHDAKLKSMLIGAGGAGHQVVKVTDEGEQLMSAIDAANEYGFGPSVQKGIDKAAERAEAKRQREAERVAKLEAKKLEPGAVTAKVGRKTFEGEVLEDGLTLSYADDGEIKETQKFRVVPATVNADQADADA